MGVNDFNKLLKHGGIEEIKIPLSKFRGHWIAIDVNYIVMSSYYTARRLLRFHFTKFDIEDRVANRTYKIFLDFCNVFFQQGVGLYLCLDKKGDERVAELKGETKEFRQARRDRIQQRIQEAEDPEVRRKLFTQETNAETVKMVFSKIMDPKNALTGTQVLVAGDYGNDILAEGEALASQLVNNNYASAIYTGDSDAFAYGARTVIRSHTKTSVSLIELQSILNVLDISLLQLQDICILSGIDYNRRSMGILNAYNRIKMYGSIEKLPRHFRVDPSWQLMRMILQSASKPFVVEEPDNEYYEDEDEGKESEE